ncbi:hypothetical protein HYPSUDRAFT_72820 [Hypholoma sublateritium FD-334 SS-4]|uniref:Uncharacterized protein n=1 Tax=Hypholoma sublateritium (strain FD-334 SS-4) TaxID=945553 RepID=A0A0D2NBG4_HYPSF|nr:hypothetical protein HYPSUDRAFT_72820 [Hypholoma sublateritium FD-334 SS-4]
MDSAADLELDARYMRILLSIPEPRTVMNILKFLAISLVNPSFPFGTLDLCGLFALQHGDVERALLPLYPLITVGPHCSGFSGNTIVSVAEKTFIDFLQDKSRSVQFYIGWSDEYINELVTRAIQYLNSKTRNKATSRIQRMQTGRVSQDLFVMLCNALPQVILTDAMYRNLDQLRLHRIWRQDRVIRSTYMSHLLYLLTAIPRFRHYENNVEYLQLYKKHQNSLESVLGHDVDRYLTNPTLTAYMILCWTMFKGCGDPQRWSLRYSFGGKDCLILLQARVDDALALDRACFGFGDVQGACSGILTDFLFDPARPGHRTLSTEHFNSTALQMLAYLCRPRYAPPGPRRALKRSLCVSTIQPLSHWIARGARRRRSERVQRGLLHRLPRRSRAFRPSEIGLMLLPVILEQCGKSEPLRSILTTQMRDIVIVRRWMPFVWSAVAEYLARTDGEVEGDYGGVSMKLIDVAYYEEPPHSVTEKWL